MVLTLEDLDQLEQTVRVVSGVSLIAVICIFVDLRKTWATMRKLPSRIILWWAISTVISIPAMLLGRMFVPQSPAELPNPMCRFQGTLLTFGLLSSILWAGCIACNLLIAIRWKFDVKVLLDAERIYHKLCWGIPAVTAFILLFITDAYGDAVFWCWIDASYEWLSMVLLNLPSLLTMISSLCMYALVATEISRTFRLSSHAEGNYLEVQKRRIQATNRFALKCSLYLLAFILAHSGEVTLYIALLMSPESPYNVYEMMAVTIPGAGAFIAIAYFATRFLKPPSASSTSRDSFYSGPSKNSSRLGRVLIRSAEENSGKSTRSVLSDRTLLSESPIAGSSRDSSAPASASTPTITSQFNQFRNSAIMPSMPPSVHRFNA